MTPFLAAAPKRGAAVFGSHLLPEAVRSFSFDVRLIR
jgi:hypothetical protein